MYYGFDDKKDICSQFNIRDFEGTVIHAQYDNEGYDGFAFVLFVHAGRFYIVQGGHCSCYGLEDQWEPDEITTQTLLHMIRKGSGPLSKNERLAKVLGHIQDLAEDHTDEELEVWVRLYCC